MVEQLITYSFINFCVGIEGPALAIPNLASGAGAAKEGVTFTLREDKTTLLMGADGTGMHSLHAGNSATGEIRLLKTSPYNALLSAAFEVQAANSSNWGQNIIYFHAYGSEDTGTAWGCAFTRFPTLTYAEDGGINTWSFTCVGFKAILAAGTVV